MAQLNARDVTFLQLGPSVLCVECELISYNNTTRCLACGSQAVVSLSRMLGGSLKEGETARVVAEPAYEMWQGTVLAPEFCPQPLSVHASACGFEIAAHGAVQQAHALTAADGAALALHNGEQMICVSRSGLVAPELGSPLDIERGLSGLCASTGRLVRCDDAERDPRVHLRTCRELQVQSIAAAPMAHLSGVFGILEVFSSKPYAFTDGQVSALQVLAGALVMNFVESSQAAGALCSESQSVLGSSRVM